MDVIKHMHTNRWRDEAHRGSRQDRVQGTEVHASEETALSRR